MSLAAPSHITRRGLRFAPVLRPGAGREWGQGPKVEGASERAPPPLGFFGRFETGERVLRASLQEPPPLLGRHHPRTSPKRSSTKFVVTEFSQRIQVRPSRSASIALSMRRFLVSLQRLREIRRHRDLAGLRVELHFDVYLLASRNPCPLAYLRADRDLELPAHGRHAGAVGVAVYGGEDGGALAPAEALHDLLRNAKARGGLAVQLDRGLESHGILLVVGPSYA